MALDFVLNPPLGIDLGTTFSAIARWNGVAAETYKIKGNDTLQSVVWYDERNNKYLTDRLAYSRSIVQPDYGIVGVKRKMDNRDEKILLGSKEHSPIEISAKILESIHRNVAEMFPAGQFKSRGVIVTVPYYFKTHQCANTREAADLAGLNCVGILQEPIAASLQYALQMVRDFPQAEREDVMLVFDLGGGTFDLTLFRLRISPQKLSFEVLSTAGDDRLGGLDFDEALSRYILAEEQLSLEGLAQTEQRRARQKLLERCCAVKEVLSFSDEEYFSIADVTPGRHVDRTVTRAEFERCIEPYIAKVERCLDDLFARGGVRKSEVTRVIKVGGSSKIPTMTELLSATVGQDKIYSNIKEDLCVAEGAAIYAAYLDDPEVFGREIEISTRTCHALGIEVQGGEFYELIPANRKTPCAKSQVFVPDPPDSRELDINVYQGSARFVRDNTKVGTVPVKLNQRRAEETEVEVTFKLDAEQMLTVVVKVGGKEIVTPFRHN